MMTHCFCGMVDRRKAFSLISSRDHCQKSPPSRISETPRAGFEPAQSLSSGLVEWSCAVMITTTPRRHVQSCQFILHIYCFMCQHTSSYVATLALMSICKLISSEKLLFSKATITYVNDLPVKWFASAVNSQHRFCEKITHPRIKLLIMNLIKLLWFHSVNVI